jgi:hypothetical protein
MHIPPLIKRFLRRKKVVPSGESFAEEEVKFSQFKARIAVKHDWFPDRSLGKYIRRETGNHLRRCI